MALGFQVLFLSNISGCIHDLVCTVQCTIGLMKFSEIIVHIKTWGSTWDIRILTHRNGNIPQFKCTGWCIVLFKLQSRKKGWHRLCLLMYNIKWWSKRLKQIWYLEHQILIKSIHFVFMSLYFIPVIFVVSFFLVYRHEKVFVLYMRLSEKYDIKNK